MQLLIDPEELKNLLVYSLPSRSNEFYMLATVIFSYLDQCYACHKIIIREVVTYVQSGMESEDTLFCCHHHKVSLKKLWTVYLAIKHVTSAKEAKGMSHNLEGS